MSTNEEQIRALIEHWAEAVHGGDLSGVLADHAKDVVMFDVPPPYEGVRGLDAYRDTWPPFFEWQRGGASFEIESLEVTAGEDVAFAYALLRCGTEQDLAANPANRLRLTFGLRREDGRWVIAHEHHSFPLDGPSDSPARDDLDAEREVRELHERWFADTAARDLDGMMAAIADDVVSYEHEEPLRYLGIDAVRELCKRNLDAAPPDTAVTWTVPDLKILVRDDLAVAWGLNHVRIEPPNAPAIDTWSRGTRVFQRRNGHWLLTHQHLSLPLPKAVDHEVSDV
ncbi:SgcJ/EcaC family oxidoreductase [Micromonospora sp. NBC_01796]|uniref:SgcJ/EcaC family oxidoreductase n=1 Tax=Micromonospora sp. NBC_01796 TaxID=2975987 RepID=UPI002DD96964|nr:SgcJ/EcaC family oxidoreductase [Micromonospora sp. NBC_01796]WSA83328.1 SgcJ/EcaC family oxidoreductase [Micromonospora sp. NBC_01796]